MSTRSRQQTVAAEDPSGGNYYGAPIVVQSCHPYKNNTCEYTPIAVPGAISYTIRFDEQTKTEAIHDYVKFYTDDRHTEYWGCGKYSGGTNKGACNWPGIGGRPPLVIPASRFVVCFRTNGSVTDWGFRLYAQPLISGNPDAVKAFFKEGTPEITPRAQHYGSARAASTSGGDPSVFNFSGSITGSGRTRAGPSVHERLHREAVKKAAEQHNALVKAMQSKLNITLRPWESQRGTDLTASWTKVLC